MTFLFTWLFNHTRGSVLYSLIFHNSMSIASVRLPEVPAYHVWVLCLLSVVLVILFYDRQFGQSDDEPSSKTHISSPARDNVINSYVLDTLHIWTDSEPRGNSQNSYI
jgi:hypothetical protein